MRQFTLQFSPLLRKINYYRTGCKDYFLPFSYVKREDEDTAFDSIIINKSLF